VYAEKKGKDLNVCLLKVLSKFCSSYTGRQEAAVVLRVPVSVKIMQ